MRQVMVQHYLPSELVNGVLQPRAIEDKGVAVFHQFSVDYVEFESGPGNFSTAIVEWPDGKVESVPVEYVRFLDNGEK